MARGNELTKEIQWRYSIFCKDVREQRRLTIYHWLLNELIEGNEICPSFLIYNFYLLEIIHTFIFQNILIKREINDRSIKQRVLMKQLDSRQKNQLQYANMQISQRALPRVWFLLNWFHSVSSELSSRLLSHNQLNLLSLVTRVAQDSCISTRE